MASDIRFCFSSWLFFAVVRGMGGGDVNIHADVASGGEWDGDDVHDDLAEGNDDVHVADDDEK